MSLKGDLGNFPIIDIIQLLNGARKSGILRLTCEKGESQLVFHAGDLVSANYLNNRVRIGLVLVRAGAITKQQLAQALDIQKNAGDNRKPLVITLLEHNMVEETAAYNGIESLIEMTIVEVLTWKTGEFFFDSARNESVDGYHFSGIKFQQRILLNVQGVLMDSLRIFDEKVCNGTMDEILSIAGVTSLDLDTEQRGSSIPPVASRGHDQRSTLSELQLLLTEQRGMPDNEKTLPHDIAVIVITASPTLAATVSAICSQENIYSVSSESITSLAINIRLLLCQAMQLVILIDVPHDETMQDTIQLCNELQKYPRSSIVLIACSRFWTTLGLQALSSGIRSIIPRPCPECAEESQSLTAPVFHSGLEAFIRSLSLQFQRSDDQRFFTCITRLRSCGTETEIAAAILAYLIEEFERAIVFSVTEAELVAEESFGIKGEKSNGFEYLDNVRIPLDDQQIFVDVMKTGQMYFGFHSDSTWPHELYRLIGRMEDPEVLLFPLVRANTVVAVIYADFGSHPATSPSLHHLNALLHYATARISVLTYRWELKSMMEQMKTVPTQDE